MAKQSVNGHTVSSFTPRYTVCLVPPFGYPRRLWICIVRSTMIVSHGKDTPITLDFGRSLGMRRGALDGLWSVYDQFQRQS